MITCEVQGRFLEEMHINLKRRHEFKYYDNHGRNDNG
jgi:hypothetical protein